MSSERAVLITGASTGIGEAGAIALAKAGFRVFAGVRSEEDGARVASKSAGITPLMLDVTSEDDVKRAVDAVGDAPLVGVVNNAGIAVPGPVEGVPMRLWQKQFDINVIGLVRVTNAFLPALRARRGRVVNISSVAGRSAMPLMGAYSGSKFAVEAISDALRVEVRAYGMKVILIEPGPIETPIWKKSEDMFNNDVGNGDVYASLVKKGREFMDNAGKRALPVSVVSDLIVKAMTLEDPKTRYLVGKMVKARLFMEALLPTKMRDAVIAKAMGG